MDDECRPADEKAHAFYWLDGWSGPVPARYFPSPSSRSLPMWRTLLGEDINSETAAARGYRVVAPAKIDDATERARLEQENRELRAVADAAQEVATAVDCLETARTVPQQRQFTDEIIDAAKKLADALAALTPGDAS